MSSMTGNGAAKSGAGLLLRSGQAGMQTPRRRWLAGLGVVALGAALGEARAVDYPSRTIRIVVPFPAGSSSDVNARLFGKVLSERLCQSVVIENRHGANGIVGADAVAKARPDGYTIGFVTGHVVAVNPHLVKNLGFDPLADFVPILVSGRSPAILVVSAASPWRSLGDLVEAARRSPGKLTFGSSGEGSPQFIMGAKLQRVAGIEVVHVPYKGETPALQDLMGGSIDFCFGFPPGTLPFIQGGRLRPLAVTTARRMVAFPDVPTVAESGFPGYEEFTLGAYMLPKDTPPAIVARLNAEFLAALGVLRAEFAGRGMQPIGTSPEEAAAMLRAEHAKYGQLVKELGLSAH
jgi:tripartite-type tricarboxylate transporter receptor subunit TctC